MASAIKHKRRILVFGICLVILAAFAAQGCNRWREEAQARRLDARVKTEFLHAWRNYERYAWGHDALRPLSKTPHDWYSQSLLMTPVDALDTLILMKLDAEAAKAKALIVNELSFDRDIYVKNFEITIRLLGGLLSSYQLTGDKRLLQLAEDLGARLLPAFNSLTGLPYVYVNLHTGQVRDPVTNPAETGTLLLEFGTLSKLTGKPIFYDQAKSALVETYKRRSPLGLVGQSINVETGAWTDRNSHISGGIDSYYEYLWKCWLLFGDTECRDMWNLYGIEPEILDYKTMRVIGPAYHLRPEIVESTYYLYHYTRDAQYRRIGEKLFNDFVRFCRTDAGYAALADVVTKQQSDEMESFALAETFKYFYLLFAPPATLDFDKIVFNTEAHPLKRTW